MIRLIRTIRLVACLLLLALPPLTDSQRVRLETAYDGRDHQEEAFAALLENARSFPQDVVAGAGALPAPDVAALLEAPDARRGEAALIIGRLEQRSPLARPFAGVSEWFVRDERGQPLLVYVVDDASVDVEPGRRVEIVARFYKRVDAVGRDGRDRSYAAFVGAHPRVVRIVSAGDGGALAALAALLAGMALVLVVVSAFARRQRRRPPADARRSAGARGSGDPGVGVDEAGGLPDDPAEALDALRWRAGTASTPDEPGEAHADA